MTTRAAAAVVPDEDDTYTFVCPECDPRRGDAFVSMRWPTKSAATERGKQHLAEHESGEPMPELADSGLQRFKGE